MVAFHNSTPGVVVLAKTRVEEVMFERTWSVLQERAPWVVVLAETRAEVDGEVDSVLEVS